MTVARAEETTMPEQPQKIVQTANALQMPEFPDGGGDHLDGVTGCRDGDDAGQDNPGERRERTPENDSQTFEEGAEDVGRTVPDCAAKVVETHRHVASGEQCLSETDDAKRALRTVSCKVEADENVATANPRDVPDETDDTKVEKCRAPTLRDDENCGESSSDCDDEITAARSVENATSPSEKPRSVFDRNENLREQLTSIESVSPKFLQQPRFVVVCEPYVPNGGELDEDESVATTGDYDPEDELNFHEAVRAGDARAVERVIARRRTLNLDEPDWNVSGDPPLLVAATNHCLPVLRVLLDNGCDPAVRSPRGETALHRAILNGGAGNVLTFVGELLAYGCPPTVKEAGGGLTALHVLTRQLAHAQGSKSLHHDFEPALRTLELLAKAGPVNARDHQGRSALHILASSTVFDNNHRTEIESLINILLEAGADTSLKNDRGETPLHESLECGALNTAYLLSACTPTGLASRYGETPLHIAARKNYAEMARRLLERGEDPAVQDAGGNTALHLASARGYHQTVSLLVTSPLAQLERTNADGLTALQVAAESGFVNAVRILLKAGADPSQTVPYCATTLHRHPDISLLIDHELTRRRQLAA